MPDRRRVRRLNQLFQEEIARLIQRELEDPRVQRVTVTGVETTADLRHAKVYVRTLGDETPVEEAVAGLESSQGFLRSRLGKELRVRRVPEFAFVVDRTLERAQRLEELLEEARETPGDDAEEE